MAIRNPRISVLMSVYNGEEFLKESIESILNQTFADFEFIFIDDGSTDASEEIVHSFSDPRLVVVQQENIGLTKSLNKGLGLARGAYIARQDADDISVSNRFEKQVAYLDAHPEVAVVGGSVVRVDDKGNALRRLAFSRTHKKIKKCLYQGKNPLVHTTVMFRRQEIRSIGGYDESFSVNQDYELWLRASEHFHLANLGDVLCHCRFHLGSISSSHDRYPFIALLALRMNEKRRSSGTHSPSALDWESFVEAFEAESQIEIDARKRDFESHRMLKLSQAQAATGDFPGAFRCLCQSIRMYPKMILSIPGGLFRYVRSHS